MPSLGLGMLMMSRSLDAQNAGGCRKGVRSVVSQTTSVELHGQQGFEIESCACMTYKTA